MSETPKPNRAKPRGPNYGANQRPETSKRVTFALGSRAQDQADRLARVLSNYRKGGVSQSALVRALLEIAESAAIQAGDPVVELMGGAFPRQEGDGIEKKEKDPFAVMLWERIRSHVLAP